MPPPPLPPKHNHPRPPAATRSAPADTDAQLWRSLLIGSAFVAALLILILLVLIGMRLPGNGKAAAAGQLGGMDANPNSVATPGGSKVGGVAREDKAEDKLIGSDQHDANADVERPPTDDVTSTAETAGGAAPSSPPSNPEPAESNESNSGPANSAASEKGNQESAADKHALEADKPDASTGPAMVIGIFTPGLKSDPNRIDSNRINPFLSTGDAKSVVYVIDKSSSMGTGNAFKRVCTALSDAIEHLTDDQKVQIIFFDDSPVEHPKLNRLMPATKVNKTEYLNWMNGVFPGGGTNPTPAVMKALEQQPQLIVLLSDGEFDPLAVAEITRENHQARRHIVRIDCIGLTEIVVSLQELAKANGPGIYYQAN